MASAKLLIAVVLLLGVTLCVSAGASSGDDSLLSSSSSESSSKCVKLHKWNSQFEKILRDTLRDLRRDKKAAAEEMDVTDKDSKDLIAELRKAWKMRCGVGCKKWEQWKEYRDIRKALVKYHRDRLEAHKWFKKLKENEQQLSDLKRQLVSQYGKVEGTKRYQAQAKQILADTAAIRGSASTGALKLMDVIQGMVHDAESAFRHAKKKVKVWRSMCKTCRKEGKAELTNLKGVIEQRRDNATKRRRNASRRIRIVKGLLQDLLAVRDKREEKYKRFNFQSCKKAGLNSFKCSMSPETRSTPLSCFRFFKCSKHTWDAETKRLISTCTV